MVEELSLKIRKQIEKAIEILRKGGIVAFPTDTVYGLGTGIYNESGIKKIYEVKKRSAAVALPVLLADASQLHEVASEFLSSSLAV